MSDYSPVYCSGITAFSKAASAAIVGGQPVVVTGVSTVGPSTTGSTGVIGIAAQDAAIGARLAIWPLANIEHEIVVVAAGTVTAGDGVISGALGTVATSAIGTAAAAGTLLGIATTTATAPAKVRFLGRG